MKREKSLDIELMRIFAVFFVIFNHTQKYGYQLFSGYRPFDIRFIVYGFLSVFCKFSVPLFYMIFGALMLDREPESYPRLLRRVGKMAGLVLGWSAIYFAVDVMRGEESFSITTFFLRIYESNWNFSFWYLYTYIALLMTLPLLQKFAQGLNDRDFLYLFGLFFLFSCFLPTVEFFLSRGGGWAHPQPGLEAGLAFCRYCGISPSWLLSPAPAPEFLERKAAGASVAVQCGPDPVLRGDDGYPDPADRGDPGRDLSQHLCLRQRCRCFRQLPVSV